MRVLSCLLIFEKKVFRNIHLKLVDLICRMIFKEFCLICLIHLISGDNELRKPLQFSNQLYSKTNLEVSVLRDNSVFKACFDNTVSILKIYCTVDTKKILLENFSLFSLLFLCSSTGKLVIFLLDRQTPGCLLCFLSDRIFLISQ